MMFNPQEKFPSFEAKHIFAYENPEDVNSQLSLTKERYEEVVKQIEKKDLSQLEYIKATEATLIDMKNAFDFKFGLKEQLSPEDQVVKNEVLARLERVRAALKKVTQ